MSGPDVVTVKDTSTISNSTRATRQRGSCDSRNASGDGEAVMPPGCGEACRACDQS